MVALVGEVLLAEMLCFLFFFLNSNLMWMWVLFIYIVFWTLVFCVVGYLVGEFSFQSCLLLCSFFNGWCWFWGVDGMSYFAFIYVDPYFFSYLLLSLFCHVSKGRHSFSKYLSLSHKHCFSKSTTSGSTCFQAPFL